jgi:hypothetical protein
MALYNDKKESIAPYIVVKNVILCRSGLQVYTADEIARNGQLDMTGHDKASYIEYRQPSVVVAAKDKMMRLPVAKEHPDGEWITPDNWSRYAKGITGESVDVIPIDGGEIGIQSSLAFYTRELYEYYTNGNKEVSLGYKCDKRWATEEESQKYGCDIMLTEITDVNHLALTALGRGGDKVAVLDSVFGGLMKMRTGIFQYVFSRGRAADSAVPFSAGVFTQLESVKDKGNDELAAAAGVVLDSIVVLKDSPGKEELCNMVQDCFDNPAKAVANKAEISKVLDSCYNSVSGESMKDVEKAVAPAAVTDTDGKGKNTNNVADSEKKEAEKKEDEKETEEEKKKEADKKSGTKDSAQAVVDALVPAVTKAVMDSLGATLDSKITAAVQKITGISGNTPKPDGGKVTDSTDSFDLETAQETIHELFN